MEEFLSIQPSELKFPFELKKQSLCSLPLVNKTNQYVAFKVKTTHPKKYYVNPNKGVILPNSLCNLTVRKQAQTEASPDLQCNDKFLIQSFIARNGSTDKDVTPDMFNKEDGRLINELKLRVAYVPANTPSPVPDGDKEETYPKTSSDDNAIRTSLVSNAVLSSLKQSMQNLLSYEVCPEDPVLKYERHPYGSLEEPLLRKDISSSIF